MKKTFFFSLVVILLSFWNCSPSINQSQYSFLKLNEYIYPFDTVAIKGYLYSYESKRGFVNLLSTEPMTLRKEIGILLNNESVAVYLDPYYFNYSTIRPDKHITYENSSNFRDLTSKSSSNKNNFNEREVEGQFIVGFTNTKRLNHILSHHYQFKKNFKVIVVSPLLQQK
jgi:hypothetical protein